MQVGYQTSKNYKDLWEMLNSRVHIVAYINCEVGKDNHSGEVCNIEKIDDKFIIARSEGNVYFTYHVDQGEHKFKMLCNKYHVEFIPPGMGIKIV